MIVHYILAVPGKALAYIDSQVGTWSGADRSLVADLNARFAVNDPSPADPDPAHTQAQAAAAALGGTVTAGPDDGTNDEEDQPRVY